MQHNVPQGRSGRHNKLDDIHMSRDILRNPRKNPHHRQRPAEHVCIPRSANSTRELQSYRRRRETRQVRVEGFTILRNPRSDLVRALLVTRIQPCRTSADTRKYQGNAHTFFPIIRCLWIAFDPTKHHSFPSSCCHIGFCVFLPGVNCKYNSNIRTKITSQQLQNPRHSNLSTMHLVRILLFELQLHQHNKLLFLRIDYYNQGMACSNANVHSAKTCEVWRLLQSRFLPVTGFTSTSQGRTTQELLLFWQRGLCKYVIILKKLLSALSSLFCNYIIII